jgi:hypothetical protein
MKNIKQMNEIIMIILHWVLNLNFLKNDIWYDIHDHYATRVFLIDISLIS